MKLSENFTYEELTHTNHSDLQEENAELGKRYDDVLRTLCKEILQPIRNRFGAIKIGSAFRCPALNVRVNGSDSSQHMKGEAADIQPLNAGLKEVYRFIIDSIPNYGQVILYPTFIHISLGTPFRHIDKCKQNLVCLSNSYVNYKRED